MIERCKWCIINPLMTEYHDKEWGTPLHDDNKLFEFIILDAFQAGLSWMTILNKRKNFEVAFAGFDTEKVAGFGEVKVAELLSDTGIIRNKSKINATINNARAFLKIQDEFGSFDTYIWQFVDGKTIMNNREDESMIPPSTLESDRISKELKARGFKFVGTTICYSFMQAAGLVNDHITKCFRYMELAG
jgi:DNA-3-methyladenine glycosylase I